MKDALILFRWDDNAFGVTGWGVVVPMFLIWVAATLTRGNRP